MAPFSEAIPAWTGKTIPPIGKYGRPYDKSQRQILLSGPRQVGYFSLTGPVEKRERIYHDDMRSLRRLNSFHHGRQTEPFNLDRSEGRLAVRLGAKTNRGENDGLHSLLKWILKHRAQFDQMKQNNEVRIVGRRALFRRIGVMHSISYNWKNERGWLIAACRFQGVIYISSFTTDDKLIANRKNAAGDDSQNWVAKQKGMAEMFKHVMRTPPDDVNSSVNVNQKFYLTMLLPLESASGSKLGFLYDAEIDGYDGQLRDADAMPTNCYDCRSIREPSSLEHMKTTMQLKYPDWWTRCYTTGERGVIVGYRDKRETVGVVQAIPTEKLAKLGTFEPADIIGSVRDVFQVLHDRIVKEDYDEKVYVLRWEPEFGREIRVAELNSAESEYKVLPDWFVDGMSAELPVLERAADTSDDKKLSVHGEVEIKTSQVENAEPFDDYAENMFNEVRALKREAAAGGGGTAPYKQSPQVSGRDQRNTSTMPTAFGGGDGNGPIVRQRPLKFMNVLQKHGDKAQQSAASLPRAPDGNWR